MPISYGKRTYPSGESSWEYYIPRAESPTGKQIKGCGFSTKKEAIEACKKRLKKLEQYEIVDDPHITFKNGCQIYFERKNLAVATMDKYKTFLKNHIYPYFENTIIIEIKPLKVDRWLDSLLEKGATISTANEALKICKAICNFLVYKEVIIKNPFKKKDELQDDNNNDEIKYFTPFQAMSLFKGAKKLISIHFCMILKFAFYTGMREGEIFGFDVKYFDYENCLIKVRQQFTNNLLTTKLKNKTSRRDIYIDDTFAKELKEYIKTYNIEGLLFKNSVGKPLNNDNFNFRWWKPLLRALNYDDRMHFNYIRHSYASIRLTAGDHYLEVSKDMGHATPLVTLRVYGHFIPQMKVRKGVNLNKHFCEHIVSIEKNKQNKRGLKPSNINGGR